MHFRMQYPEEDLDSVMAGSHTSRPPKRLPYLRGRIEPGGRHAITVRLGESHHRTAVHHIGIKIRTIGRDGLGDMNDVSRTVVPLLNIVTTGRHSSPAILVNALVRAQPNGIIGAGTDPARTRLGHDLHCPKSKKKTYGAHRSIH